MYFYIPVSILSWCAIIGHVLFYSVTIKCLNYSSTIFWTPDVGYIRRPPQSSRLDGRTNEYCITNLKDSLQYSITALQQI